MVTFQQAYEAAAARYAPEVWADLSPDLRIKAIYEEMRRLDSVAAAVMDDADTTHGKPRADQEQLEHVITRDPERRSARDIEHQKIDRSRIARKRPRKQTPPAMGRRLLEIVVYGKRCRIRRRADPGRSGRDYRRSVTGRCPTLRRPVRTRRLRVG